MMRYVSWNDTSIGNFPSGIARILTEVDERGRVLRELGLDATGSVIYRAPSTIGGRLHRGYFDGSLIKVLSHLDDCTRDEFEAIWSA